MADPTPPALRRLAGRPFQGLAGLLQAQPADLSGPFGELPGAFVGVDQGQLLFHVPRMTGGYDSPAGLSASVGAQSYRTVPVVTIVFLREL